MGRGVDQRASSCWPWISTNAVPRLEHLHPDRLIVDKGPRASIGELNTAQDQFILDHDVICAQQIAGGVIGGRVEGGVTCPCAVP